MDWEHVVELDDGRVLIDVKALVRRHDVAEDSDVCAACGDEYPCVTAELASDLDVWLDNRRKAAAKSPAAAGQVTSRG